MANDYFSGVGGARQRPKSSTQEFVKNLPAPAQAVQQYKVDKYGKAANESFERYSRTAEGRLAIAETRKGLGPNRVQGIGKPAAEEKLNRRAEEIVKNRYTTAFQNKAFERDGKKTPSTSNIGGRKKPAVTEKPEISETTIEQQPQLEPGPTRGSRTTTIGKSTTQVFDINSFRSEMIENDVLPSHSYLVTFSPFRSGVGEEVAPLNDFVVNKRNTLMMRCENIVLPTPTLLEEENIRRYGYGPVEKVPYGIQFSDVTMTWIVDSKSEIIDFMHQWMNTIVMHDSPNTLMVRSFSRPGLGVYNPFEVGYKDAYANPIVRVYVYNRQQQTVTEYELYDVFPMNIQSINLSWADENQFQKLTVTFGYTNMKVNAPLKTTEDQINYYLEGRTSPYEERQQPENKGGKAAADREADNLGLLVQALNSKPVASDGKYDYYVLEIPPKAGTPNPPSPVTRDLTST